MNQQWKDRIYSAVHQSVLSDGGREKMLTGQACLNWMVHGAVILGRLGIRAIPQAGSASFRFLPEHMDDGVCMTHFSYEWSPHTPQSKARLDIGQLPEIHCWLALPQSREIVDFSTGYIQHAARLAGLTWQAEPLPPYTWRKEGDPHPGTVYRPCMEAIVFILTFMKEKALQDA